MAPHPNATLSSRHLKRSSYEFENSLQHVLFECQPSSCFFTVSCGRIDFVRLKIRRVIGTLNDESRKKNRFRELRLTIRGRSSTAPFVGVTVVKSEAMPSRYSTARFGGVTVVLAGNPRQRLPVIPKSSSTQIVDFVDAPGGTGKTFLEETVLARIRSEGTYALAVASSDIAAQLLPKGSTAHLRFKIPIDIFDDSRCNVPKQGQFAELWDEAPMQHRRCFRLVDRMLQNMRSSTARFGGLTVVLVGNPKRCLPVGVTVAMAAMPSRYSTARFGGVTVVLAAMPSRYSTARFGGVTVVLAGDPKQCLPVTLNGSVRWSDRRVGRQRLPVIPKSSSTQIVDFVDAPGGTGKTFLEETVLARIRSEGTYALAVASSARHIHGSRSRSASSTTTCNVPKQEQLAELWDEAPMQHRRCFQLVDRMLQHVRSSTARVGGLTAVFLKMPSRNFQVIACSNRPRLHHGIPTFGGKLRWTTARILIVARRLGGLKASNDEGLERVRSGPVPQFFAEPCLYRINIDRRITVRNLRERVQFAHGDIPPPHSHRLHCVHCREPTLDMT
ncbi:BQ5605_C011g06515 [Microbotryum silenes-dioicae]|uniref:ATP-dependent DNA helicase n=1 Tax=Microbotryum silenes-dioicae TaxID=796604 RepID=A0A2X0M9Z5_9BASI|nr:BQ5605_C011g06515 [Microbotryum silenes-dioicae]